MTEIDNKAYFMLPGFCEHYETYKVINQFLSIFPEAKRDNAEVYCYYGNIPFCTWDGGRIFQNYQPLTMEQMYEIKNFYNNNLNSKIRFVFTNNLLKENHCHERYNNICLEIFNDCKNEIVLNSSILENYIRTNYSNYSIISSTTKCLIKPELAKEELNQDYKFVCLDYNLNHNWSFLDSLNPEEKEKTEFLINPICGPACPQRKEHYRLNSLFSLSYGKPYNLKSCEIKHNSFYPYDYKTIIQPDELYSTYLDKGFKYFKLEGRTFKSLEIIAFFAKYLIKPEYQYFFIIDVNNELERRKNEQQKI